MGIERFESHDAQDRVHGVMGTERFESHNTRATMCHSDYGVATLSRLLKITDLFGKRAL